MRATASKTQSNGRAGEEAAQHAFRRIGWTMFKTEPPVKNCGPIFGKPGQFKAIYTEGGMPDFVGYADVVSFDDGMDTWSVFRACEVKEATPSEGDSVPHSRLSAEQRAFMDALPEGTAYVGILWRDGTFEIFPFDGTRGSYRKGQGLK